MLELFFCLPALPLAMWFRGLGRCATHQEFRIIKIGISEIPRRAEGKHSACEMQGIVSVISGGYNLCAGAKIEVSTRRIRMRTMHIHVDKKSQLLIDINF